MNSNTAKIEINGTKPELPIVPNITPFICDLTQYSSVMIAGHLDGCPWLPRGYEYDSDTLDGLHTEIEYFDGYMEPTPIEYTARVHVVKRIEKLILQVWPDAYVEVTGDVKYGLYLPNGDILVAVQNCQNWNRSLDVTALKDKIMASGVAEPNSIEILTYGNTNIPALHLTDRESKINVGIVICVDMGDIMKRTQLIKYNLHKYPVLSKLILVLKQFWQQYDLNGSKVGISLYDLITMCVKYLQSQPTQNVNKNANLGYLLIGFFDMFGGKFDFRQNCIEYNGRFLPQEEKKRNIGIEYNTIKRCSEDPAISLNNIDHVKCAFQYAHNLLLSNGQSLIQSNANGCMRSSLLGRIIKISDEVIEYRKWIHITFRHILQNHEYDPQ